MVLGSVVTTIARSDFCGLYGPTLISSATTIRDGHCGSDGQLPVNRKWRLSRFLQRIHRPSAYRNYVKV